MILGITYSDNQFVTVGNLGTILTSEATSTNLSIDIETGEGIVRNGLKKPYAL